MTYISENYLNEFFNFKKKDNSKSESFKNVGGFKIINVLSQDGNKSQKEYVNSFIKNKNKVLTLFYKDFKKKIEDINKSLVKTSFNDFVSAITNVNLHVIDSMDTIEITIFFDFKVYNDNGYGQIQISVETDSNYSKFNYLSTDVMD